MKKILILLFLILCNLSFTKELKNVVIYEKDVSTGEVIDRGSKESQIKIQRELIAKIKRYEELSNKSSLSGKETREMIELKDYLTKAYYRMKEDEEKANIRNAALAEQDVINRMTSEPVPERLLRKEPEKKSILDYIF